MTNIVNFPKIEKREKPLPRQRVFYIASAIALTAKKVVTNSEKLSIKFFLLE